MQACVQMGRRSKAHKEAARSEGHAAGFAEGIEAALTALRVEMSDADAGQSVEIAMRAVTVIRAFKPKEGGR